MFRVSLSSYSFQLAICSAVFKTVGGQTVNMVGLQPRKKSLLSPQNPFLLLLWNQTFLDLPFFSHFTCRFAQVFSSLLSFLVRLAASSAARRVKQAWECAGDVLDFHYWLWHIRQRTQHVLFKGKLCSSACFKCVSKAVVKDAIY